MSALSQSQITHFDLPEDVLAFFRGEVIGISDEALLIAIRFFAELEQRLTSLGPEWYLARAQAVLRRDQLERIAYAREIPRDKALAGTSIGQFV